MCAPALGSDAAQPGSLRERKDGLAQSHGHHETQEEIPTTYARRLDWASVSSFEVEPGALLIEGETTGFLRFGSRTHVYTFSARAWNP